MHHTFQYIRSSNRVANRFEQRFAPDLALLASLVGDGSLKLALVERSWRDISEVGPELRDRHIAGKAVFRIDQT